MFRMVRSAFVNDDYDDDGFVGKNKVVSVKRVL